MAEVRVRAMCYPTEDRTKVEGALSSIFPGIVVQGDVLIEGTTQSLEHFAELLVRQQIRDAARAILWRNRDGNTTSFTLNKQVATVGKISFAEESHPLGDIEVTVTDDCIESLIDRVAPSTRAPRGKGE